MANALRSDQARELHRLTEYLLPVVRARVARVLASRTTSSGHLRAEVEDLTQEVFADLFDNGARILRRWNPARGASLKNHVGLVTERRVRSLLRSRRITHWREQPVAASELEFHALPVESPARMTAEHQYWERVVGRARARLSARGLKMLDLLLIQQRSVAETAAMTGQSVDSIYAWRSRLQKLMRTLARELRVADRQAIAS